ncbi:tRNA(adenine34) deaminase [Cytospora paraplurivora]|uniref:tRNA(Adenine34) deaminase n=1 Tax=Cytospora paraplurivora TaxID=2898453 RepID=A0AAN9TY58_9PEZI
MSHTGSDDTTQYQQLVDQDDEQQQEQQQQPKQQEEENDGDHDGDPGDMQGQLHGQRLADNTASMPQQLIGPKDVSANGRSNTKVALPQVIPAANGHAKQNAPSNIEATKTALGDVTNSINNQRFSAAEKNEAKEGTQDDLQLPPAVQPLEDYEDPEKAAEREIHHGFMNQALDMARLALKTNETPVGCVLVHNGRVIARGMNATNVTRNGTRHAELMALTALLSFTSKADVEKEQPKKSKGKKKQQDDGVFQSYKYTEQDWGDVDPKDGHIYPYGQKLHPAPVVDRSLVSECTLYVTVEPCVMCASMLRQFGIKKVYFGAVNDKFGGTGGVFCIHMNSEPVHAATAPATPIHRPIANQLPRPPLGHKPASTAPSVTSNISQEGSAPVGEVKQVNGFTFTEPPVPVSNTSKGHGGNVEVGFEAEGGWRRDEAVNLLRQFYVQENGRAPVPRKKEGRAARLAAIMESQGMSTEGTALEAVLQQEREALEKAAAEDAKEEQRTADQNGTNWQTASVGPAATPEAKLDAEPAERREADDARTLVHAEEAQPLQEDVSV